jgi:hypothetical protein
MKRKRRATTSYEKAMARKTGASVRKLRKEQAAAESLGALAKARTKYKDRGDPSSCGDEVAHALKDAFTTDDGDFDLEAFKRCLKDNDVQAPKVDESKPGWPGRFRMCTGISLRAALRKNGKIVVGERTLKAKA